MSFDQLWAGWRSSYVSTFTTPEGLDEHGEVVPDDEAHCIFCRIIASDLPDLERHVVAEDDSVVTMLNAYPYASGHLLVMPRRHARHPGELSGEESASLWAHAIEALGAIERAYAPDGVNLGVNLGRAAGAGIPRHLHLHLVPRWVGDTNFMTAVAAVRVMPESLGDSFARLRDAWPT